MATYDYRCDPCAHSFVVKKPMSQSDSSEDCPKCAEPARKTVSRSSFLLKGRGWYKDGYSSQSPG